jgi:antitoxin component YwqK of YwqJK toxin-antitoxin module
MSVLMNNIKRPVFLVLLIFYCVCVSAQEKTIIYYHKDWKPCKKEKAIYYREIYYQSDRKPVSIVKDYYMNGILQWEGKLISENPDVCDSICNWYDDKGRLLEQRSFKSGQLNGPEKLFYTTGALREMNIYKNGLRDGKRIIYTPEGVETIKEYYVEGRLEGERFEYDDKGHLYQYAIYKANKLEGTLLYYDSSGKHIIEKIPYQDGKMHGIGKRYYPGGKALERNFFNHGIHLGPDTMWYENGGIWQVTRFEHNGDIFFQKNFREDGSLINEHTNKEYPDTVSLHIAKDNINCLYGLKDYKKQWVLKPVYTYISEVNYTSFYRLTSNNKQGIADAKGVVKIQPLYDRIDVLQRIFPDSKSDKLNDTSWFFIFTENGRSGLMAMKDLKVILKPEFDHIQDGGNGLFKIVKDGLEGLANQQGMILQPRYTNLQNRHEGLHFSFDERQTSSGDGSGMVIIKTGLIDRDGDTILPPVFDQVLVFSCMDSLRIWATVKDGQKKNFRLFNMEGKELLSVDDPFIPNGFPQFNNDGLMTLKKGNIVNLVDINGRVLNEQPYPDISILESQSERPQVSKASAIYKGPDGFGLLDKKGQVLLPGQYAGMDAIKNRRVDSGKLLFSWHFIARKGDKSGVITENDSVIFPFMYDAILTDREKLYLIHDQQLQLKNKYNYAELSLDPAYFHGAVAIIPFKGGEQYHSDGRSVSPFKSGIVNDSGRILLEPVYALSDFKNGKAEFYNEEGLQGYVNADGDIVYSSHQLFRLTGDIKDGYAWVLSFTDKMGVVDQYGKLVVDTIYDAIGDFDALTGTCWVKPTNALSGEEDYSSYYPGSLSAGGWGLVNREGRYVLDTVYPYPSAFHTGRSVVTDSLSRQGLIDENGTSIMPFIYEQIIDQGNGVFLFRLNNKWGMADRSGRIIVNDSWTSVSGFSGRYALYSTGVKTGLVDIKGSKIMEVEKVYNREGKLLADSLFLVEVADGSGENRDWNSAAEEAPENMLISEITDYEKTDSITNPHHRIMARNRLFMLSSVNILHPSLKTGYPEVYFPALVTEPESIEMNGTEEGQNNYLSVYAVNRLSFSVDETIEDYFISFHGSGYNHYSHVYYNYAFTGDSLQPLKLKHLFNKGYEPVLKRAVIQAMKTMDDPDLDCTNPDKYLEVLGESFVITAEGLLFFFSGDDDINEDNVVELLLPYSAVKNIINRKGVLGEFVK